MGMSSHATIFYGIDLGYYEDLDSLIRENLDVEDSYDIWEVLEELLAEHQLELHYYGHGHDEGSFAITHKYWKADFWREDASPIDSDMLSYSPSTVIQDQLIKTAAKLGIEGKPAWLITSSYN